MFFSQDSVAGFAKYILFAFNLLMLCAAAILIGMSNKFRMNNHGLDYSTATIFPIVIGVLIALIAFFGCCGAVRESSCMLITYATILIILFFIQLLLGILASVAIEKNVKHKYDFVHDYLEDVYKKMKSGNSNYKEVVDNLQKALKCCGVDRKDEGYVKTGNGTNLISSCCKESPLVCTVENAYYDNCSDKLADKLVGILEAIGIAAIIFGAVELVAAIFAFYVTISSQNSLYTYNPMGIHT